MKNTILKACAGFALALIGINAAAQQLPVCINHITGYQVPIITNAGQSNPAYSTLDPRTGSPEIFLNIPVLQNLGIDTSPYTLTFIVEHECGHVNLGHLTTGPVPRKKTNQEELAADCYAAHAVKKLGFNQSMLHYVLIDVDKLPKDPDHPAGIVRAANIVKCFGK